MQPVAIVEGEILAQGASQRAVLIEFHFVEAFELEGVKEGFDVSVVIHGARAVHALDESVFCQRLLEEARAVFDTAIGVEEDTGSWLSQANGMFERGDGQVCCTALAQGPADDAAREAIHDDGEVSPLTSDLEVSDITDPQLVGAADVLAPHDVVHGAEELHGFALAAEQVVATALQGGFAHEASDAASTNAVPQLAQGFGDAWAAIAVA